MDVRNVGEVEPEVEHNGTVPVWWLIKPREMFDLTDGGYLELANELRSRSVARSSRTRTPRTSSIS